MRCYRNSIYVLLLTALSTHLFAQTDLTVAPLGLIFGTVNAGVDVPLSEDFSIGGTFGITLREGTLNEEDSGERTTYEWFGLPVSLVGKYYFSPRKGNDRFYLSTFLRYVNRNLRFPDSSDNSNFSQHRLGLGFGFGTKIVSNKGLVLDLSMGVGRAFYDKIIYKNDNGDREQVDWIKLMIVPRIAIGYRFGS